MTTPANPNPMPFGFRRLLIPLMWIGVTAVVVSVGCWLFIGIRDARESARRTNCKGMNCQIALALHNYQATYGCFLPAYVADATGRPVHSWRVLILPFIDQAPLYNEFRFDEPWDGPNNRKLSARIVWENGYSFYHCPSDQPGTGELDVTITSYVAVVGQEATWKSDACVNVEDFTDGPESTLMIVEVANSGINWMEPRDRHILQMAPTINPNGGQGISSRHPGGANSITADGRARFLFDTLPAGTLRALLTINGGVKISSDEF